MATLAELLREGDKNAVVSDIYRNVLGREIDPTGYAWTENLNVGIPESALDLARKIAQSEEGRAYAKDNQGQYNYLAGLSQANNPYTDPVYSSMEYLGNSQFRDASGGIINLDEAGQPISYNPGASWYDQQLAKNPNALRGTDYRNQTYLAGGPLDQTYNFNGKDVPIQASEYQVDPKTGQFIKGPTGENKPVEWRPQGYNMWDDWGYPAAVFAVPALAAGAVYAAPYLAGEGALSAGMVDASGNIIGAGTQGAAYGGGTLGAGASQWTPEIIAQANASGDSIGYLSSLADATPAEMSAWTTPATGGGMTGMQKAMLVRQGMGALGQIAGGTGGTSSGGYGSMGGGTGGMTAYQRQGPFLSTAQQNVVPDSTTEALTKLLRGYNG